MTEGPIRTYSQLVRACLGPHYLPEESRGFLRPCRSMRQSRAGTVQKPGNPEEKLAGVHGSRTHLGTL